MNKVPDTTITKKVVSVFANPRRALAAAAVLHLLTALLVFGVGRYRVFPQHVDEHGIGQFALDGHTYRVQADSLAQMLQEFELSAWFEEPAPFHVKLYSFSFALLGPLLGSNILAAEPLNLLCYLTILILTFSLAKMVAGQRAAWLASAIVALWPSLLLHATQVLKDHMFIAATLALILVLANLLTQTNTLLQGMAVGAGGVIASVVCSLTRGDVRLVLRTIVFFGVGLFLIRALRERKLMVGNLVGMILLLTAMDLRPVTQVRPAQVRDRPYSPLWAQIATARRNFASEYPSSGSNIDADVQFSSAGDVIRYVPRALEIGLLAPFPAMWFRSGQLVGRAGRLVAGLETLLTYLLAALACIFIWKRWRCLPVWLLAFAVVTGATTLGLVVVNLGALYRMRYAFWVLLTIVGSGALAAFLRRIGSEGDGTARMDAAADHRRQNCGTSFLSNLIDANS